MRAGSIPSAVLEINLIMENNLMLMNNIKQAALNCPGPAGVITTSKFNYFLRKQLGRSVLSLLFGSIIQIGNVNVICDPTPPFFLQMCVIFPSLKPSIRLL